jgi:site-specific DNA recombinase
MTAVIYARQSLDRDGEGTAVNRQITECYELAKRNGITIAREFIDNDVSATKGIRPAFNELLEGIRSGQIDTIVVWHTDRLYRRVRDLVELVELAEKHSLRILTARAGDLDLNNPAGRMMAQMLGAAARYEIEQKSARQVASNVQRAKRGVWQFSQRPYGYDRVDGEVIIIEDEAQVVREIIDRYVDGQSWYAIMKELNARGLRTQKGKVWSHENVRLRALNPAYAGIRNYLGDVATENGEWPPIIDREKWERFENVLAARKPDQTWAKKLKYLGSGLYRCGNCGDVMKVAWDYNNKKTGKFPVYQCRNHDTRRKLDLVDELVEQEVFARLSLPGRIELLTPSEDASILATKSKEIRERIEGLAALYADGILTAVNVREQKARLHGQLDDITRHLDSMQGGNLFASLVTAQDMESHWREKVSLRDQRRIIDALMTVKIMPVKVRGGFNIFDPTEIVFEDKV